MSGKEVMRRSLSGFACVLSHVCRYRDLAPWLLRADLEGMHVLTAADVRLSLESCAV